MRDRRHFFCETRDTEYIFIEDKSFSIKISFLYPFIVDRFADKISTLMAKLSSE